MRAALAILLCLGGACARMMPPPGGPEDKVPPQLRDTYPDSLRSLPDFKGSVEFQFNEVVSEGSQPNFGLGTGDLERLVVLSPSREVPVVKWKRDRIDVRPRNGWRPNTVYRVELLAGLRDLRNNELKRSTVVTFTTGAPLPTDTLVGRIVDWTSQRPSPGALVEAVLQPDSLAYRTTADSTGRFRFGPLPHGEYLVYGVLDANRNAKRDPRESFDSLRIAAGRDTVGEVWAFKHDTTAAKITAMAKTDSLSATMTFSQSLDPATRTIPADSVRVLLLPDSTALKVEALVIQPVFDSLYKPKPDTTKQDSLKTRPDSAKAKPDTAAARKQPAAPPLPALPRQILAARQKPSQIDTLDMAPLKTKPPLFERMVLRLGEPFKEPGKYYVEVRGVKNVSGVVGEAHFPLVLEAPKKPTAADSLKAGQDSLKAKTDSVKARPDSVKARPDSTKPPR